VTFHKTENYIIKSQYISDFLSIVKSSIHSSIHACKGFFFLNFCPYNCIKFFILCELVLR
jgi:hypothetical protein